VRILLFAKEKSTLCSGSATPAAGA